MDRNHDIIVVGSSMGGIEALGRLLAPLPPELPASIFIVQHTSESPPHYLDQVLRRSTRLPLFFAADRYPFQPGSVYVASPGHHLILEDGVMRLVRGPKQNRARPAVDPLFHSAAVAHGPHVVGVVLTGYLDDGSAGLAAIKRCGGKSIVQHPQDAAAPSMPTSALHYAPVDHCVPVEEIPPILERLASEPAGPAMPVPPELLQEVEILRSFVENGAPTTVFVPPSVLTCPECGGGLRSVAGPGPKRYRCHTGHSFTGEALLSQQSEASEQSLWAALRALKERAKLSAALAAEARKTGARRVALNYEEASAQATLHAAQIECLLTGRGPITTEESTDPVIA